MNQFEEGDKNFQLTNAAQLQRWLPWLRMFRGFRIAIDYQKIIVALIAVVLWLSVSQGLTSFFVGSLEDSLDQSPPLRLSISQQFFGIPPSGSHRNELPPFESLLVHTQQISWFFDRIMNSILDLVNFYGFSSWWHAWLQLLWGLATAALFGGIISRMAAREFTGQNRSLIRDSKFGLKQAPVVFFAPFIALVSFGFLWCLNWLAGLIGRIPLLGEIAIALCYAVFLFLGLLMFLLLLGLIFGWPLMICSGAVEKNDTFDALSRAFSYLLNRPWYAFFLSLIAVVYGSVTMLFVTYATRLSIILSLSPVGAGIGESLESPPLSQALMFENRATAMFENDLAASLLEFWIGAALLVPAAYAFSFFWSSTTIGYFLLRRREDGTPLHSIELSDAQTKERPDLAVVGIPAADLREKNQSADDD